MAQDILYRGLLAGDTARFAAVSGRTLVETARELHGLSRVCTAALGRTLLCCCMMGAELKNDEDRLSAILKGGGPAGNIVCSAHREGAMSLVKGYIENPALELPLTPGGKLDVASAVGFYGDMVVTRDMSLREPYVGHAPLTSGEIAEDFARYFTASEQQPSMVYLGVHVAANDGHTLSAGGLIVQPLPNCPEDVLDALQARAKGVEALSGMLEEMELSAALAKLFEGVDMRLTETLTPQFRCDCSRERLERVLLSLGREELEDMREKDGGAELTCHFCNKTYGFDGADLDKLLAEAKEGA